jgi:uncharacterized membrane protein YdjX (TVP38/TMEM64 family)
MLVAFIVLLGAATAALGVPQPSAAAAMVADFGPLGPPAVVAATALLLAALVPRSVLAAAAGLVFGPLMGSAYVLAGAALGAMVAFTLGRWLGRDFLSARLTRLDRWLTTRGTWPVVVLRILPIAPFGLVSYGFGTTAIRVRHYLAGTAIGVVPSTVVYAHLGAAAMRPGSTAFLVSCAAAVVLAVGVAAAHAVLRRQKPRASAPR